MSDPLRILIVEDEALLVLQLEMFLEEAGHIVAGAAMTSRSAMKLADDVDADLALVDIHLADGPLGCEVGRYIAENTNIAVVFMTANPKRIPEDFSGAIGVIAKPYTQYGLEAALAYLVGVVKRPPPTAKRPPSLTLAPAYDERWGAPDRLAE